MIKVLFYFIAIAILIGGCGYKAPPYYENHQQKVSSESL